jgi:uncharacterized membrane protein YhfC
MIVTAPLAALLEILFPIAAAIWFIRWTGVHPPRIRWLVVFVGAAAFLLSQVLHIPFLSAVQPLVANSLPANLRPVGLAVFLGLAAGLFEETARVVAYVILKDRARSWNGGVALGIGHGGAESAIFVGLTVLATSIYMLYLRGNPQLIQGNAEAQIQVTAYWATAWYIPLVGLVERVMTFTIQIGLSVIVLQAFLRHNALWYAGAVLFHALIDALAVIGAESGWGIGIIEGIVLVAALASLWIIRALRPREESAPGPGVTAEGE